MRHRAAHRRHMPGSEPRHHDGRDHFIASATCRRMPLPVPQPCRRMAPKQSHHAARHAEIALSKTARPSLPPLRWVSHRLRRRPAHRSRRQPDRQISIGGYPTIPRGFLPWRLSDAGPHCRLINCEWAGIRNPSHPLPYHGGIGMVRCTPESGRRGSGSGSTPLRRFRTLAEVIAHAKSYTYSGHSARQ